MANRTRSVRWTARLLVFTVTCGCCEGLVRLIAPQPTLSTLLALTMEQYEPGDVTPFTLKRSYHATAPSMEFPGRTVSVQTNRLGLRGPELEEPARRARVLFLGDSYTFGVYCDDADTYPQQFEALYGGRVEAVNAGYADGWSPDEHYAWLRAHGLALHPNVIVYGLFVGNDIDDIAPEHWAAVDRDGLPTRIVNPDIWIDPRGRIRSRVADDKTVGVERIYRVPVLRESHVAVFLSRLAEAAYRRWAAPAEARSPTPLRFPVLVSPELAPATAAKLDTIVRLAEGMQAEAQTIGARVLVLLIPVNFQVDPAFLTPVFGTAASTTRVRRDPFEVLEPALARRHIPTVNLLRAMRAHPETRYFPMNGEVHFNPAGHRFAAATLKAAVDRLGWIESTPE